MRGEFPSPPLIPCPAHRGASILAHPLLDVHLTRLRDAATPPESFRAHVVAAARVLAVEAARALPTREQAVTTPLEICTGREWAGPVVLVPILRAGLGLMQGFLEILPTALVGHLGLARDEETLQPLAYYARLPAESRDAEVLVLDPMLATGGSAAAALSTLKERGCSRLHFCCLLATPEGLARLEADHPDVPVLAGAVDRGLNAQGYIVPGLGDAGDRFFGT